MVGGGQGAFIGARAPHRGADRRPVRAGRRRAVLRPGPRQGLGAAALASRRTAPTPAFEEMATARGDAARTASTRSRSSRPNHMHAPVAKAFLEAGIHVICDKPLTTTLADARRPRASWSSRPGMVFALTHNYTGYPMVRQAREMVADGRARRRSAWCRSNIRRTG